MKQKKNFKNIPLSEVMANVSNAGGVRTRIANLLEKEGITNLRGLLKLHPDILEGENLPQWKLAVRAFVSSLGEKKNSKKEKKNSKQEKKDSKKEKKDSKKEKKNSKKGKKDSKKGKKDSKKGK